MVIFSRLIRVNLLFLRLVSLQLADLTALLKHYNKKLSYTKNPTKRYNNSNPHLPCQLDSR